MRKTTFILLLLVMILLSACSTQSDVGYNTDFTIQVSHSAKTLDGRYIITFDSVFYESRCPDGAQCIWAGSAGARFTILENGEVPATIELYVIEYPNMGWYRTFVYKDFKVEILELNPYPSLNKTYRYNDYKAKLKLTKNP